MCKRSKLNLDRNCRLLAGASIQSMKFLYMKFMKVASLSLSPRAVTLAGNRCAYTPLLASSETYSSPVFFPPSLSRAQAIGAKFKVRERDWKNFRNIGSIPSPPPSSLSLAGYPEKPRGRHANYWLTPLYVCVCGSW